MAAIRKGTVGAQEPALPHRMTLDERQHLEVTGVREVVRFDETTVALRTVRGILLVRGEGLRLQTLSPENGRTVVDGTVNALAYEQERASSFLRRLLG